MTDRIFTHEHWATLLEQSIEAIKKLAKEKGGEYAGDTDRLANFRRNALRLGVTKELIWAVYANKHWDAINQYVQDRQTGRKRVRSEPLENRVDDLIVYLLLFKAILWETEESGYKKA